MQGERPPAVLQGFPTTLLLPPLSVIYSNEKASNPLLSCSMWQEPGCEAAEMDGADGAAVSKVWCPRWPPHQSQWASASCPA